MSTLVGILTSISGINTMLISVEYLKVSQSRGPDFCSFGGDYASLGLLFAFATIVCGYLGFALTLTYILFSCITDTDI